MTTGTSVSSQLLQEARKYHLAGELQVACDLYQAILEHDAHYIEARYLLGIIACQMGQPDKGRIHFKQLSEAAQPVFDTYRQLGKSLRHQRHWEAAAQCYRRMLTLDLQSADILSNLGSICREQKHLEEALLIFRRALRLKPDSAVIHFNTGHTLQDMGRYDDARHHYQQAITLNPNLAEAYHNLGFVLQTQGHLEEALAHYQKALAIQPNLAEAYANIGLIYHSKQQFADAIQAFEQSLALNPNACLTLNNYGTTLKESGQLPQAMQTFQRALEMNPQYAPALNNIAILYKSQGYFKEAVAYFQRAIAAEPTQARFHKNLGDALLQMGEPEQAIQAFNQSLALSANNGLRVVQAMALPPLYQSTQEIETWRTRFSQELQALEASACPVADPVVDIGTTAFFLAYQGLDDTELQKAYGRFFSNIYPWTRTLPPRPPHAKPKIGFISRFLMPGHTISKVFLGLIEQLSRDTFDVTVFTFNHPDPLPIATPHTHHNLLSNNMAGAYQAVAQSELDILVYLDIGMDPLTYFLAYNRLAPVQCVTWGHPVTTGIDTIDYYISSRLFEPEDAPSHYSERLILLNSVPTYYTPPAPGDTIYTRRDFGFQDADHLYLCPQTLFKLHPDFDALLGDILRQDPQGWVVLANAVCPEWNEKLMSRFRQTLPDVADRIRILEKMPYEQFLGLLSVGDVMLDSLYFGGGSTTYEAFSLGVPIVTWPWRFMRGRMAYGLYQKMGVTDCIASSAQEYVDLAVRLGTDPAFRRSVHEKILARNHALFQDQAAVRELEQAFLQMLDEATRMKGD